jgi:hypothetical protein
MKRVLYSGVASDVHEVADPGGERGRLLIVVDPDSGDQVEILYSEAVARDVGRKLAAPPGRLPQQ